MVNHIAYHILIIAELTKSLLKINCHGHCEKIHNISITFYCSYFYPSNFVDEYN